MHHLFPANLLRNLNLLLKELDMTAFVLAVILFSISHVRIVSYEIKKGYKEMKVLLKRVLIPFSVFFCHKSF